MARFDSFFIHLAISLLSLTFLIAPALADDATPPAPQPTTVTGIVFIDANANGQHDTTQKGLADVAVTNGTDIVTTDATGRYTLAVVRDERTFISIATPAGYRNTTPFFHRTAPAGIPASQAATLPTLPTLNFGLAANAASAATKFSFAHITDIHVGIDPPNSIRTFRADLTEIFKQTPQAAFIVATGDLVNVGSEAGQYDHYVEAIAPFAHRMHHVMGNHDLPATHFERNLGPSHYSFDFGPAHIVVLNCIEPDRHAAWLKADLERQPKAKPILVCPHYQPDQALRETLSQYNVRAFFHGHWHSNKAFHYKNILVLSTQALRFGGIDCAPRGYRLFTVDGNTVTTSCHRLGVSPQSTPNERIFEADGYAPIWSTVITDATGTTAPRVVGDRVYVGVQDDANARCAGVVCLDRRTGKRLWKTHTDSSVNARPVVANGLVCAISVTGTITAWDTETSDKRWTYAVPESQDRWAYNGAVVDAGQLVARVGTFGVCIDQATGKPLWQVSDLGPDWVPCAAEAVIDEKAVYVLAKWSKGLIALDRKTGNVLWTQPASLTATDVTPTLAKGRIYTSGDENLFCFDAATGKELRRTRRKNHRTPSRRRQNPLDLPDRPIARIALALCARRLASLRNARHRRRQSLRRRL